MSLFGKWWKKEEPKEEPFLKDEPQQFEELSFGKDAPPAQPFQQQQFGGQAQPFQQQSFGASNPQAFTQQPSTPAFAQQGVQSDQQLQLINAKLDTIKAQLDMVLSRLDKVESSGSRWKNV